MSFCVGGYLRKTSINNGLRLGIGCVDTNASVQRQKLHCISLSCVEEA